MFSFLILFVIGAATIYWAVMYDNVAMMLLVFMEAAFFVMSFITIIYRKCTVKAVVDVPIGISEIKKENMIKIMIRNNSPFPITRMKAYVSVVNTNTKKKKKDWMKLDEVREKEAVFTQNIVFVRSGNYEISLKKLRIYDMTGLMYGTMKLKSTGKIQVIPEIHELLVHLTPAVKNFYGESDVYDAHAPGYDNNELFGIREYRGGDRLQNVHWKMTAKQDELMVKEHSLPKACPVILILDFHKRKSMKKKDSAKYFMEVVASLSFSMMDAGCPHYVAWYEESENDFVRVRVDDEESLFVFISMLMNIQWSDGKEDIVERYKEKFKSELYVWMLSLNEKLELKKSDELLVQISEKQLEKSLSQIELLL